MKEDRITVTTDAALVFALKRAVGDGVLPLDFSAADYVRKAREDAQALADVRTLDEWVLRNAERSVELYQHDDGQTLTMRDEEEDRFDFFGATPEGARAQAAECVRKQAVTTSDALGFGHLKQLWPPGKR